MSNDEHRKGLAQALAEARQMQEAVAQAPHGIPPLAPRPAPGMKLPTALVEEAAVLVFEFWERHKEEISRGERRAMAWKDLAPRYQIMWLRITRMILEMSTSILLRDLHEFLEQSNGDMGAAFAKAVRRYAEEVLSTQIP